MKLFYFLPAFVLSGAPVPNPERIDLPENCPKNVDPELCFEFCRTMTCWEYPNNWPKLNPKVDELLTRSRRGAELTREGLRTGSIDFRCYES